MSNLGLECQNVCLNFHHQVPQLEHVGESIFLMALEDAINQIIISGNVLPETLGLAVEIVLNQLNLDESRYVFRQYDEIYFVVYQFLETVFSNEINLDPVNYLINNHQTLIVSGIKQTTDYSCVIVKKELPCLNLSLT